MGDPLYKSFLSTSVSPRQRTFNEKIIGVNHLNSNNLDNYLLYYFKP